MSDEKQIDISDLDEWFGLPFLERVEALRQTITVPEVAQLFGIEADQGDKIRSPWNPDERTPSCHLYDDHFYDYSTGRGGDIFDLAMALNPESYPELKDALKALHQRAVSVGKQYGDVEAAEPRQLIDFSEQFYKYETVEYWHDLYVLPYHVLWDPTTSDVFVPHRDENGVYGVKVRWRDGGKGSWAGSQFMHRLYDPFGWAPGYTPKSSVVICEGESDAWAMVHAVGGSADVLALPSGAGSWRDHWLEDLTSYSRVLVCMDNDKTGREARDKLMRKVGYARAERLDVPQLYGDAREAISAGWRPSV